MSRTNLGQRTQSPRGLSIVLPTRNEIALGVLPRILSEIQTAAACADRKVELICVDSGSSDGTVDAVSAVSKVSGTIIDLPDSTRAARLNAGIARARYSRILLHHPRSVVAAGSLLALHDLAPQIRWGGFTHAFDADSPGLRWTSYYSNRIRMDRSGIVYLDHCVFLNRDALPTLPEPLLPDIEIFEDTALSRRLRSALGKPHRLAGHAVTSAVRYRQNGVARQMVMNQILKVGYAAGVPDQWMNKIYERGLRLNNDTRRATHRNPTQRP